jgi:hypothetical protein
MRFETLNLLQGRMGKVLEHRGICNIYLNRTPIAQKLKERN